MSEDWKWLEYIEKRITSQNAGEHLFSPALQNIQSEQLLACIKEMREGLKFYRDELSPFAKGSGDWPMGIHEVALETLNRCARGEFEK